MDVAEAECFNPFSVSNSAAHYATAEARERVLTPFSFLSSPRSAPSAATPMSKGMESFPIWFKHFLSVSRVLSKEINSARRLLLLSDD
ncbi:hypothetical protein AVEN_66823-1 [Araneus ventricosus]|uniref:Uncharacterized protein n=1 Tax=Araneus ventricosus TaxID=182803 RepID=A0A4Y2DRT1_ARAVE|nr:hypothetical protein AVEN_66823-1 [Araneus ventricosus]